MFAVAVTALKPFAEYLGKEMRHLFRTEINHTESFYTGYIYKLSAIREVYHFRECCGVHSGLMKIGYDACAQSRFGGQRIDQG